LEEIDGMAKELVCEGKSDEELVQVLAKLASYVLSAEVVVATRLVPALELVARASLNLAVASRAERLRISLARVVAARAAGGSSCEVRYVCGPWMGGG
jgi:BioD-like phosphotransacetylase family protein